MDCTALELDAVKFAKTAVTYDQSGKHNEAVFYYKVSGYIIKPDTCVNAACQR